MKKAVTEEENSGLAAIFEELQHDGMDQHDFEVLTRNRRRLGQTYP
jgi:hypothetical protein